MKMEQLLIQIPRKLKTKLDAELKRGTGVSNRDVGLLLPVCLLNRKSFGIRMREIENCTHKCVKDRPKRNRGQK